LKLLSFADNNRKHSYGIYSEGKIIDLGKRLQNRYPDLKTLISLNAISEAAFYLNVEPDFDENEISFLPVIPNPGKIICGGMNYLEKCKEFDQSNTAPTLFIRFPDSQTGHKCPLLKPACSQEFDYEGELAVVIGKAGRAINERDALSHVAGYSCYMDGSVRDWQYTWFTAGKNWPQTGALGPYLVTTDEIPDPQQLSIHTYLNRQVMQNDNTKNMLNPVSKLISYISTFTSLQPGDVIITGSPGGVGKKRTPPIFMKAGDIVEVEIERIGRLTNQVIEAGSN
jgi:2-keto-4-pentenoate hydratase/2-oxohepta-3-ene-1,7-dioic acid hydratase in catechol pathway